MLLSECIENYLEDCYALANGTQALYAYHLKHLLSKVEKRPMSEVTVKRMRSFMSSLHQQNGKEYSKAYQNQVYRTLNTFFAWAVREGDIENNPMKRVRCPQVPKRKSPRLTLDEVERLLDAVGQTTHSIRNLAMVCLMVDSGLRRGEVVGLTVGDVDLDLCTVRAFGKDKKERDVPLGAVTLEAIKSYLAIRPDSTSDALFLTLAGAHLTLAGLHTFVYRLKKQSGIPQLRCHLLRHTFANHFINGGGGLRMLSKILGHAKIHITAELYTDPELAELQRVHSVASPLAQLSKQHTKGLGEQKLASESGE